MTGRKKTEAERKAASEWMKAFIRERRKKGIPASLRRIPAKRLTGLKGKP